MMLFSALVFIFLPFSTSLLTCCEGINPLSTSIHANDNIETKSIVPPITSLEDELVVVNTTQPTTNNQTSSTKILSSTETDISTTTSKVSHYKYD